jgi:hypothetical protein
MNNRNLSLPQYAALIQAFQPLCHGCFDFSPSIFDWRAISWAGIYPKLDPQKIISGVDNRCMSCTVIDAAFRSIGFELHTLKNHQYLSLLKKKGNGSLFASAAIDEERNIAVELYVDPGEFLHTCLNIVLTYESM